MEERGRAIVTDTVEEDGKREKVPFVDEWVIGGRRESCCSEMCHPMKLEEVEVVSLRILSTRLRDQVREDKNEPPILDAAVRLGGAT